MKIDELKLQRTRGTSCICITSFVCAIGTTEMLCTFASSMLMLLLERESRAGGKQRSFFSLAYCALRILYVKIFPALRQWDARISPDVSVMSDETKAKA